MPNALPRRARAAALLATAALLLSACDADPAGSAAGGPGSSDPQGAEAGATAEPVLEPVLADAGPDAAVLPEQTAPDLALATSQLLFQRAPVLVVAPAGDPEAVARAGAAAVALGVPALVVDGDEPTPDASSVAEPSAAEPSAAEPSAAAPSAAEEVGEEVGEELERLGAGTLLVVGDPGAGVAEAAEAAGAQVVRAPAGDQALSDLLRVPLATAPEPEVDPVLALAGTSVGELRPGAPDDGTAGGEPSAGPSEVASPPATAEEPADAGTAVLPRTRPAQPGPGLLVMTTGEPEQLAAVATARAAGAELLVVPGGDPRRTAATVEAVAAASPARTVGLGAAFGDAETLRWRTATAATGVQLPGGGQLVLPGKTYVALYGSPITASLGVLGEQGPDATVERAATTAEPYRELTDDTVVPALEIIATVASGSAGRDGDYSNEWPVEDLRPLVDRAGEAGQYVVLDLQPGRTDFLSQAKEYEELLRLPHVGLALDPEWRLEPDEVHLRSIGSVDVAEVDEVVTWLADLTREERLPQKMLVLHQFQVRMIPGVDGVDQSRSEVEVLVHVDGQGSQGAKQDTWRTLLANAESIEHWGWKNFYDEDTPMLSPEETMQVEPQPDFVSYQ